MSGLAFILSLQLRKSVQSKEAEVLTTDEETVLKEFMLFAADTVFWEMFNSTKLNWISDIVSLYENLGEIAAAMVETPNFYGAILNYCAHDCNYLVYTELKTGKKHKLNEICTAINNYNNYN